MSLHYRLKLLKKDNEYYPCGVNFFLFVIAEKTLLVRNI